MNRPIDAALSQDRPAKRAIRQLWLREVRRHPANGNPIYLTLPGTEGKDIDLLINEGVIATTETGAIAAEDIGKVVAVESNSEAVLSLQRKYPGLRIHNNTLESLMNGGGPYAWPNKNISRDMRAKVVNIDLDKSLRAECGEEVSFPLIKIIKKISQLHRERPNAEPAEPWSLCVTVNSTIEWPEPAVRFFFRFLANNCSEHQTFKESAAATLGDNLVNRIIAEYQSLTFNHIDPDDRAKLLCIFLPKLIMCEINDHHWEAIDCSTLSYGGNEGHAAMTTITIAFRVSNAPIPSQRYASNICNIFPGLGRVLDNGTIELG